MASDDFLYLDVLGDRNLLRNIDQMPDTVRAILLDKVEHWTNELADAVRENIESRFKNGGARMKEDVQVEIIEDGLRIDGRVFIAGNSHARIQEEGGQTPPHMIYPTKGKVLAFMSATGEKVFATRVFHPGGQIPAKHFMKDAFREKGPQISRGIKNAVVQGIRAKMRATA